MVRSMTGFGRYESTDGIYSVSLELKSVNHRFLDVSVKLPRQFSALEDPVRRAISERLTRGHVDAYLAVRTVGVLPRSVQVDSDLAKGYALAMGKLADALGVGLDGKSLVEIIAKYPDVLRAEEVADDIAELADLVQRASTGALDELVSMRGVEGQALVQDLRQRLDTIITLVSDIESRASGVVEDYRKRLNERIAELLGEGVADPARLAVEVAIFADRSNITEELVRLASHINQFKETLSGDGTVGRRLDFLMQEMFREVNTIGSKANDYEIASLVVSAKTELEKIREQVQNIE